MKKVVFTILAIFSVIIVFGQNSLEIYDHNGMALADGETVEVVIDDLGLYEVASLEYFIKNNSAQNLNIKCRREVQSNVPESANYFCALGVCYAPFIGETPNPYAIAAGELLDETVPFSAHYSANNMIGTSLIKYVFYNVDDESDNVSLYVSFNGGDASLQMFKHTGEKIESGSTVKVFAQDMAYYEAVSPEVLLKNISGENVIVKLRTQDIDVVSETTNSFCIFTRCLPPGVTESTGTDTVFANQIMDEEDVFSGHYYNNSHAGESLIRYKFFNVNDTTDAVDFYVSYVVNSLNAYNDDSEFSHSVNRFEPSLSEELVVKVDLKSFNTQADVNFRVQKTIDRQLDGSDLSFSFGGVDYISEDISNETGVVIPADSYLSDGETLYVKYNANGGEGNTFATFRLFNTDNENDYLDISFDFDTSVDGVLEIDSESNLSAYPNPATENVSFNYKLNDINNARIVVYNSLGIVVMQEKLAAMSGKVDFDLTELSNGVYLYRIEGANANSKTQKMIVQ